ncbi:hypothetical protein GCM10025872_28420 [Barrientosiimonas endolithica]|uniref:Uncharacterized protein n=1 Tax=Barrientosiimonas endolithica TaxID=1535208 RepID=A0ABM8HDX0_9MICO|nr:hypothetical protein GCM10025872_28420 [Barrientosiimonas endolithica]
MLVEVGLVARADLAQQRARLAEPGRVGDGDVQPRAAHLVLELVGRALGDDLALVDHDDVVGQPVGLLEVLRGEQHGGAAAHQVGDDVPHVAAAARVEAGGRLVEEDHRRVGDQRAREVEPAPHAAGVGLGGAVGRVLEAELREQLAGACLRGRPRQVIEPRDHLEVLEAAEVLVDRGVLPADADAPAHLAGLAHDVGPGHGRVARVGLDQGGEHAHRRGLAGPVRAQHSQDASSGTRNEIPSAAFTSP